MTCLTNLRTWFLLLSLLVWSPQISRAQPATEQPNEPAREAFEAGRDAYERGAFSEALTHYERAYTLSPHAAMMFNIGRAADADGQLERAVAAYSAYLRQLPNAENAEFVRARLDKLQPQVSADSAANGSNSATTTAGPVQNAAPPNILIATPRHDSDEPSKKPFWKRAWFWTTVGVVVAAGVTTGVLLATRDVQSPHRTDADLNVSTLVWR